MAASRSLKTVARVQAKSLRDATFRRRLMRSPRKVLAEEGVRVPAGVKVKVHQNSGNTYHLVLPGKPAKARGGARRPRRPGRMGPQFTIPI